MIGPTVAWPWVVAFVVGLGVTSWLATEAERSLRIGEGPAARVRARRYRILAVIAATASMGVLVLWNIAGRP